MVLFCIKKRFLDQKSNLTHRANYDVVTTKISFIMLKSLHKSEHFVQMIGHVLYTYSIDTLIILLILYLIVLKAGR